MVELDKTNKELTDHKYRSEAAIRELKTKLRLSEEVRGWCVCVCVCALRLSICLCMSFDGLLVFKLLSES